MVFTLYVVCDGFFFLYAFSIRLGKLKIPRVKPWLLHFQELLKVILDRSNLQCWLDKDD